MQHPDEGMIHTWLDGQMPADEAAALEAHIAECEQCKASVAEARGFVAASSRIIGALDNVPSGIIPIAKPVNRAWYSSPQFRAAAAVLVVAGASFLVMRTDTQKAAFPVTDISEANEAATAQRAMSARSDTGSAPEAAVSPPVLNQVAGKVEAAKPSNASADQALKAPRGNAMKAAIPKTVAPREEDFSGKGVKGGAALAAGGVPARDSSAIASEPPMKAADALSMRRDFQLAKTDLKVIRVDSSATTKKTTYESSAGKEIVLTEEPMVSALSDVVVTGVASRERAAAAPSPRPTVANTPVPSVPAAQKATEIHTISWFDPSTRRHYSLSGPVPVEELEAIKARLLKPKQ